MTGCAACPMVARSFCGKFVAMLAGLRHDGAQGVTAETVSPGRRATLEATRMQQHPHAGRGPRVWRET